MNLPKINTPKVNFNIIILLFLGLLLRLILANFGTLDLDHGTFIAWGQNLVRGGFDQFYNSWSDYLPGYLYVLFLITKLQELINFDQTIIYKLPAMIADVVTAFLIFKIVNKQKGESWGLLSSALYIFNPAILANSTLWGQVDSLTALFSILTIYFVNGNVILSAIFLALGTLVKPQAALCVIPVLFLMIRDKWKYEKILIYVLLGAITFVLGFVPFAGNKNLISFVLERVSATTNQYPYTSVNAFNFWAIVGMWKRDDAGVITSQMIGYVLTFGSVISFLVLSFKNKNYKKPLFEYQLLSVALLSMFLFFTRMHERHLLPALAPLVISFAAVPTLLISYLGLSLLYVANLRYAFVWINEEFKSIFSDSTISFFSILSVASLIGIILPLPKKLFSKIDLKKLPTAVDFGFPKINLSKEHSRLILIAILLFGLLSRVLFLDSPKNEYFDEVYHAFTARTLLHNDEKAWEWWNTPPEGFAYEWTHPPLAKLAMWGSMTLLGENSFAWRIPQAIAGTLIILVVYLLSKEIFKDEVVAILSAAVMSLDGLALVMSRIGMNDSYFLLFALLSIYFFIKDKNLFSAIFLGLAASSKWTTMWVLPILLVSHFVFKVKNDSNSKDYIANIFSSFRLSYLFFLIIPVAIYMASYIPFFTADHKNIPANLTNGVWGIFEELQKQMWWYHTNLRATHAYSSNPLSWPFLIRPIYLYTSGRDINGMISNIYAMGNPIVFWVGLISVFVSGYYAVATRNKKIGFIVFCYFALFLPWAASPRIMFLYHYLPAVPFLAIATGYVLRRWPRNIWAYFLITFIVFIYFYPHWTVIKIPAWLDSSYYWLDSWR